MEHSLQGNHHTLRSGSIDSAADSGFNTPGSDELVYEELPARLYVWSSADQAGLQRTAVGLSRHLQDKSDNRKKLEYSGIDDWRTYMPDLAYTLGSRRTILDHRSFAIASTMTELTKQLDAGTPKLRRSGKTDNTVFIFTGQGAQWATMGKALQSFGVFRDSLDRSQASLDSMGCSWSIIAELEMPDELSNINLPEYSQPLCTVLQLALVDLLRSWGISPRATVGHSSGEIAAAYAAGLVSGDNAIRIAYFRGLLSADVNRRLNGRRGAMMAVGLSAEKAQAYLDGVPKDSVVIACINAPDNVTLSGDEEHIDSLETALKSANVFARKLRVQTAYHSPHMKLVAEDYLRAMGTLEPPLNASHTASMFSSVTGEMVSSAAELDGAYWVRNMLNTVQFAAATKTLFTQPANAKSRRKVPVPYAAMIECGPADALKGPLNQILAATDERLLATTPYVSMLKRKIDARLSALEAAGRLWAQGLPINLACVNFEDRSNGHQVLADLPPYPFNHSRTYFHESGWGRAHRHREKPRTDLLGMPLPNQDATEPRWHNYIRLAEQPWIADHKVQHMVLYPGAGMIVMAVEAARELIDSARKLRAIEARNILFKRGVVVPGNDGSLETAIHLRPSGSSDTEVEYTFKVFSQLDSESWHENCSGAVAICYESVSDESSPPLPEWDAEVAMRAAIERRATRNIPPATFYRLFDKKMNLQYGPLHQNVTHCVAGIGEGLGSITIPDTRAVMPCNFEYPHLIHPSTLDSVFHMQALGYLHSLSGDESLIPISIESVYIAADVATEPGAVLSGYSKGTQSGSGDTIGDIVLSNEAWAAPKIVVRGFLSKDMSATTPASDTPDDRPRKCTTLEWREFDSELKTSASVEHSDECEVLDSSAEANKGTTWSSGGRKFAMLYADNASRAARQLGSHIIDKLTDCPEPALEVEWSKIKEVDTSDRVIVSLVEVEMPLVASWSSEDFDHFKALVTTANSLLWLTRGGDYHGVNDLAFSISTGLLRTVRVEKPQLKLPHLDLSPATNLEDGASAELVLTVLDATILTEAEATEQELAEDESKLFVPRLITDESFHAQLGSRSVGNGTSMQVLTLDSDATYVLSGGLGGIGRSIADLMFVSGARRISFISRSGASSKEAQQLLGSLRARGCIAEAYRCDIASSTQVENFVQACRARGERIKGVIQCAMVLRDSMFDNMSYQQWSESTQPKVQGTWNLHQHFPKDMQFVSTLMIAVNFVSEHP